MLFLVGLVSGLVGAVVGATVAHALASREVPVFEGSRWSLHGTGPVIVEKIESTYGGPYVRWKRHDGVSGFSPIATFRLGAKLLTASECAVIVEREKMEIRLDGGAS